MSFHMLFAPGWAMESPLWDRVWSLLARDLTNSVRTVLEPGYFGRPPMTSRPHGPTIAIGHSLGLMQLLLDPPPVLCGLVSINGFTRFGHAPDHPAGISPRVLGRMRQFLAADANAAASAFRARCGLDGALPGPADPLRLASGLDQLETCDCRVVAATLGVPIRALAGGCDAIAPPALTRDCFADLDWVSDGGHLLPLSHPERCADAIRACLAAVA